MNPKFGEVQVLGRVTIPKKFREYLGMIPGDPVKFTVEDGKIIVEKVMA